MNSAWLPNRHLKTPVLVLFGPTASGKTALLEQIFASGEMQAEIISADSMQVYRGMDIGTAKPSLKEREKIPHHLIDLRDPKEQFNAGEFVHLAEEGCLDIAGRGKLPVVSGGTGFYLKNLILGLPEAPPSDMEIRLLLKQELLERGAATLMEELSKADPVSASRIHVNDEYRLLRALEVLRLTGRPLSSFTSPCVKIRKENHRDHGVSRRNDKKSNQNSVFLRVLRGNTLCFFLIGLKRSREELYRRINERTAAMFRAGLPTEVKRLYDAGYTPEDPGLRAIGYREFFVIDNGAWRLSEDLAGVEALVAQNSRRYAKRQITFFASLPNIKWVDCGENIASEIESLLQNQWLKPGK